MNSLKPICKKNNALSTLKHLRKLSLKRTNKQNDNNMELTQFDIPQNSTILFEPIKNSTFSELGLNKDNIKDNQVKEQINKNSKDNIQLKNISSSTDLSNKSETATENTPPNSRSSSKNLANKSNEIEDLLNSLDDDVNDHDKINEDQNKDSPTKTNKFFRSKIEHLNEKILLMDKSKAKSKTFIKKQNIRNKRRFSRKRSALIKRNDIYEFLSQSQTSDSDGDKHLDPAADIIKKLIDQGKVRVATNCKGKGKPVFKRKIPHKQIKKIKQNAVQKRNKLKTESLKETKNQLIEDNHIENDFDHAFDDEALNPDAKDDFENVNKSIAKRLKNNSVSDKEGTFSRLARSVLVHQASRSNLKRKEKSTQLLEMVKKYISTPKNKRPLSETALNPDISPILMPPPRPKPKVSPWRVDEDDSLPRVFNFSRSSANLPSFSSDYIPSSPRKEKSRNSITERQQQSSLFRDNNPQSFLPLMENQNSLPSITDQTSLPVNSENEKPRHYQKISTEREPSSISSFSSNDSNAENMPPPTIVNENHNENNDIFNLKQLPNPRRVLTSRSPLKTINILEVVNLPPYKIPFKSNSKVSNNDAVNTVEFKENILEKSLQTGENIENIRESPQKSCDKKRNELAEEDLFGFEEFLSETNGFSQEDNCINENDSIAVPNITIHEKLQDLRKLKPDDKELQLSLVKKKLNYPLALFEDEVNGAKQKNIKEMLCSTMMQPTTSKNALKELKTRNLWVAKKPNVREDSDLSELFKDLEPETTFNENGAHRTYVRPFKRKRRLKENKYLVFLESDESGGEEMLKDHEKHNHSNENDTSSESSPKKKRQRKLPKENKELKEFVEEFNKMCAEVESFELRVEKST